MKQVRVHMPSITQLRRTSEALRWATDEARKTPWTRRKYEKVLARMRDDMITIALSRKEST